MAESANNLLQDKLDDLGVDGDDNGILDGVIGFAFGGIARDAESQRKRNVAEMAATSGLLVVIVSAPSWAPVLEQLQQQNAIHTARVYD